MATVTLSFRFGNVATAGIIAGAILAAFDMMFSAIVIGANAFFMPLRMIGAIVLGPAALDADYSLPTAAIVGLIVRMILSVAFAMVFAWLASPTAADATLAFRGMMFGTVLWIVNFYVIAPLAGWAWFPERTNSAVQFLTHAFLYGCPLG